MLYRTMKVLRLWVLSIAVLFSAQTAFADDEGAQNILHVLQGHWDNITDVAFSPNGKYVATASQDSNIIVWNVNDGSRKFTIKWHDGSISATAFSPDNKYIYSGSEKGRLSLYSVKKGKQKEAYSTSRGGITDLNYSPDGKSIVVSYLGGRSHVVDILSTKKTSKRFAVLKGHKEMVQGAMFSPDGKSVLTHALDSKIVVWNAKTGDRRFAINSDSYSFFDTVAFSPDGQTIVSSEVGNIALWSAKNGHHESTLLEKSDENFEKYGLFFAVAYHPNGQVIATASSNGNIYLWNANTGALQKTLEGGHTDQVRSLAFNEDGSLLVTGSFDHTAIIWKLD